MKETFVKYFKGDKIIWLVILFLTVISIVSVYSSIGNLAYRKVLGDASHVYMLKHLRYVLLGFVVLYIVHRMPYSLFFNISGLIITVAVLLLFVTLLTGRWIRLGSFGFQPSDLARIALIVYISRILSTSQDNIENLNQAFMKIIIPVGGICGLIITSNSSTAIIVFLTSIVMMFIGRVPMRKILLCFAGLSILVVFMYFLGSAFPKTWRFGTFKSRIDTFIYGGNEDTKRQPEMAKAAIASSGAIGKMPGNSSVRYSLSQGSSDFIYAIIIEEWGSIIGVMVLLSYLILLFRTGMIVKASSRTFPAFLSIGLVLNIVFQALVNMSVAVGLVPVTGQPLPLISMGGTSIIMTFLSLGVVLSISRSLEKEEQVIENQVVTAESKIDK